LVPNQHSLLHCAPLSPPLPPPIFIIYVYSVHRTTGWLVYFSLLLTVAFAYIHKQFSINCLVHEIYSAFTSDEPCLASFPLYTVYVHRTKGWLVCFSLLLTVALTYIHKQFSINFIVHEIYSPLTSDEPCLAVGFDKVFGCASSVAPWDPLRCLLVSAYLPLSLS